MKTCTALKQKHKLKTILFIAVMVFSVNAFSQTVTDFKPKEIYGMLGMDPDYCIEKLKANGFEYSYADGNAHVFTPNGNATDLVGTAILLNYEDDAYAVNIIAYSTLDYAFVSQLRVFLQVGFYTAADVGDARVWENAKGTTKIFLTQTKTKDDQDQYNVAFKNVVK